MIMQLTTIMQMKFWDTSRLIESGKGRMTALSTTFQFPV